LPQNHPKEWNEMKKPASRKRGPETSEALHSEIREDQVVPPERRETKQQLAQTLLEIGSAFSTSGAMSDYSLSTVAFHVKHIDQILSHSFGTPSLLPPWVQAQPSDMTMMEKGREYLPPFPPSSAAFSEISMIGNSVPSMAMLANIKRNIDPDMSTMPLYQASRPANQGFHLQNEHYSSYGYESVGNTNRTDSIQSDWDTLPPRHQRFPSQSQGFYQPNQGFISQQQQQEYPFAETAESADFMDSLYPSLDTLLPSQEYPSPRYGLPSYEGFAEEFAGDEGDEAFEGYENEYEMDGEMQ
jgi:hypothetical protein